MIDAPVLQVRDWLDDPATGVNAQILAMPLPTDAPDPPPPLDQIYAESDHAWVARVFQGMPLPKRITEDGPIVLVGAINGVSGNLRLDTPGVGRVNVDVAICYAGRSNRSEELVRDARQTFRACLRAVAAPFAEDLGLVITRDGVDIEHPAQWGIVALGGIAVDDIVYGALVLSIPVVDPWALGVGP